MRMDNETDAALSIIPFHTKRTQNLRSSLLDLDDTDFDFVDSQARDPGVAGTLQIWAIDDTGIRLLRAYCKKAIMPEQAEKAMKKMQQVTSCFPTFLTQDIFVQAAYITYSRPAMRKLDVEAAAVGQDAQAGQVH